MHDKAVFKVIRHGKRSSSIIGCGVARACADNNNNDEEAITRGFEHIIILKEWESVLGLSLIHI